MEGRPPLVKPLNLTLITLAFMLGACGSFEVIVPTTRPAQQPTADNGAIRYPAMPRNLTEGRVTRVVDGDTFDVRVNGETRRVRLIGMNTPESVDPRRPVECFGLEASKRAKELLEGKTVLLEEDPSQDSVDRFGRWLRFAWFTDGRLYNLQMIAEGYAYEYTYDVAYKYQRQFREAQRAAERADRGLWSPKTCNGQR